MRVRESEQKYTETADSNKRNIVIQASRPDIRKSETT